MTKEVKDGVGPGPAEPSADLAGENGWQPIATAPRDGTAILARGPVPVDGDIEVRQTLWNLFGIGSIARALFDRGEGPSGNWRWSEPVHNWCSDWSPTHWMPLDPPALHPQTEGDESREEQPSYESLTHLIGVMAEALRGSLAAIDAADKACPVRQSKRTMGECLSCGATESHTCGKWARAAVALEDSARAALQAAESIGIPTQQRREG